MQPLVQHFCLPLTSVAVFHLFTPLLSAQPAASLPHFTDHPLHSTHPSDPLHCPDMENTLCMCVCECVTCVPISSDISTADSSGCQQPGPVFLNNKTQAHTLTARLTRAAHSLSNNVTFEKFFSFQNETRTGKSIPGNV